MCFFVAERKHCSPYCLAGWAERCSPTADEERSWCERSVTGEKSLGEHTLLDIKLNHTKVSTQCFVTLHVCMCGCKFVGCVCAFVYRMASPRSTWQPRRITWRWCVTCWKMKGTKALQLRWMNAAIRVSFPLSLNWWQSFTFALSLHSPSGRIHSTGHRASAGPQLGGLPALGARHQG